MKRTIVVQIELNDEAEETNYIESVTIDGKLAEHSIESIGRMCYHDWPVTSTISIVEWEV